MHIVDEPRKFSPSNVLTYTVHAIRDITEVVKKLLKIQQCWLATIDSHETLAKRLI